MLRSAICISAALVLAGCASAPAPDDSVRVRITAGASAMVAELDDTPTARSFAAQLPLQVLLRDHDATEKVATLSRPLSLDGAPAGADAAVYDIAYYAPLGNFVIYYRDPGYFPGLVRLGRIVAGAETLEAASGPATIERISQ